MKEKFVLVFSLVTSRPRIRKGPEDSIVTVLFLGLANKLLGWSTEAATRNVLNHCKYIGGN